MNFLKKQKKHQRIYSSKITPFVVQIYLQKCVISKESLGTINVQFFSTIGVSLAFYYFLTGMCSFMFQLFNNNKICRFF